MVKWSKRKHSRIGQWCNRQFSIRKNRWDWSSDNIRRVVLRAISRNDDVPKTHDDVHERGLHFQKVRERDQAFQVQRKTLQGQEREVQVSCCEEHDAVQTVRHSSGGSGVFFGDRKGRGSVSLAGGSGRLQTDRPCRRCSGDGWSDAAFNIGSERGESHVTSSQRDRGQAQESKQAPSLYANDYDGWWHDIRSSAFMDDTGQDRNDEQRDNKCGCASSRGSSGRRKDSYRIRDWRW